MSSSEKGLAPRRSFSSSSSSVKRRIGVPGEGGGLPVELVFLQLQVLCRHGFLFLHAVAVHRLVQLVDVDDELLAYILFRHYLRLRADKSVDEPLHLRIGQTAGDELLQAVYADPLHYLGKQDDVDAARIYKCHYALYRTQLFPCRLRLVPHPAQHSLRLEAALLQVGDLFLSAGVSPYRPFLVRRAGRQFAVLVL